ncbi:MAG TPA: hypothetical protein VN790_00150 [Steroidobacteraceae bacterium]|nr:hypothetical protein [Steroidobacteraceae bacterium]
MSIFDLSRAARLAEPVGHDAANDATGPAFLERNADVATSPAASGWDPLEIWRTRVRDARRKALRPASP